MPAFEQEIADQLQSYGQPLSQIVINVDVQHQIAEVIAMVVVSSEPRPLR